MVKIRAPEKRRCYKQVTARGCPIRTFLSANPKARISTWQKTVPAVSVRSSKRSAPDAAVSTFFSCGGAPSKAAGDVTAAGNTGEMRGGAGSELVVGFARS